MIPESNHPIIPEANCWQPWGDLDFSNGFDSALIQVRVIIKPVLCYLQVVEQFDQA